MNIKTLKKIAETDKFTNMPLSAQALYFHFAVRADRFGIVHNPQQIERILYPEEDEMKLLEELMFVRWREDVKMEVIGLTRGREDDE